jgi:hypothetical protein
MKVDVSKLYDILLPAISDATDITKRPSTFSKKIISVLAEKYNFPIADATEIMNGNMPIDSLSEDYLYKITKVLYLVNMESDEKYSSTSKLNVDNFFHEVEKEFYENKYVNEDVYTDLVFDKFIEMSDDMVFVKMSNKQIAQCRSINRFKYNPSTQRNLVEVKKGKMFYKQIPYNHKAGDEIREAVINNRYITDTLYIGVNPDTNGKMPYISKEKYIIPKECTINILEGFHRYVEISNATYKDKDDKINLNMGIYICLFPEKKSKALIIQKNKKTPLSEEQVKEDDPINGAGKLIKRLNEDTDFYLHGKLVGNIYVPLNNIMDYLFDVKEDQDRLKVFRLIFSAFNKIVEEFNLFRELSIEEWFIYLYVIKYADLNNKNACDIIKRINMQKLLEKIKIKKKPSVTQERIIEKEVKENV